MTRPLEGRRTLITGGNSGIGRLLAFELGRAGSEIVIWDIVDGTETVAALASEGIPAHAAQVDISDNQQVDAEAALTGDIDIVINNAGIVTGKDFLDQTHEDVERTFGINVLPLYSVTRAFLPDMVEKGVGMVVTIASAAGLAGVARQTDYSASKFAAVGFTESLRAEMKKHNTGVRTLTVCPYYISTGMFDGVQTKFPRLLPILTPEKAASSIANAILAGKEELLMPPLVKTVPIMRVLPTRLFDKVMDVLGVNATMDHFTGRHKDSAPRS